MAASVRIEDEAFVDPRVELLGTLAGFNRFEALGRLAHLWRVCTQRETYVLPELIVIACLGDRGALALIESGLGERTPEGIRVKGTEGRIEWLQVRREAGRRGGLASGSKRQAKATSGKARGKSSQAKAKQASSKAEANVQQGSSKSNPPTPTPTPDLPSEEGNTPLPPAKPGGGAGDYPTVAATGDEGDPECEQPASRSRPHLADITPDPEFDPTELADTSLDSFGELLAAWSAAKLPGHNTPGGIQRTEFRVGHWQTRQRDPTWRARWRAAVARAGQSSRCRGADPKWPQGLRLDTFVKTPDVLVRLLEGEFDDAPATLPVVANTRGGKPTAADVIAAHRAKPKPTEGVAS